MTERPAVGLPIKVGFTLLVLGVAALMWTGDWRWVVAGALALLLSAVLGVSPTTRKP